MTQAGLNPSVSFAGWGVALRAMRWGGMLKRVLPFGVVTAWAFVASPAWAAMPLTWVGGTGQGSSDLPCTDGGHWALSQAEDVTSATLLVGGSTYDMQRTDSDVFSADSAGAIVLDDIAVVTYEGGDSPAIALTGCVAPSPSPTTSPSPTDAPPTSSPPPVSSRPVAGGSSGGAGGGKRTLRTQTDPSAAPGDRQGDPGPRALAGTGPTQQYQRIATASRSGDPASAVTGTVRPPLVEGGATSGIADPRTPPVALVIGVLTAVVVISSFGARQYFARRGTA
jgi:hypothetical protein